MSYSIFASSWKIGNISFKITSNGHPFIELAASDVHNLKKSCRSVFCTQPVSSRCLFGHAIIFISRLSLQTSSVEAETRLEKSRGETRVSRTTYQSKSDAVVVISVLAQFLVYRFLLAKRHGYVRRIHLIWNLYLVFSRTDARSTAAESYRNAICGHWRSVETQN